MANRRGFLKGAAALPLLSAPAMAAKSARDYGKRDYFAELGVRPFINAAGTFTTMTASLMPPEVMAAMEAASRKYVPLMDVQKAVGAKIAQMLGSESAMVTSGAAAAICVATAGCITGMNQAAVRQLPDTTGLKHEIIVQKKHRNGYDHALRTAGGKLVEIETAEEFAAAVNDKTAMAFFANFLEPEGKIKAEEFVALGKKHKVPTFNDCSADVPPISGLTNRIKLGFDLVTVSGGKGIRGPQSAGLLLGRADLIEAAKLNTSPNSDSVARGMKVNKEEMIGMMVALELFMKRDYDADMKEYDRRVKTVVDAVSGLPSITHAVDIPAIANRVPHLKLNWDVAKIKISPLEVARKLREGEPSIEVNPATNAKDLVIGVWMLEPGEAQIVARRVRDILKSV